MEKGKRIQKHDNRAALTDGPEQVSLREKQPIRHYQVGMRYRKRTFLPTPDNYLHLVSKSQDIKRIEHIKEDRGQYSQKIQTEVD